MCVSNAIGVGDTFSILVHDRYISSFNIYSLYLTFAQNKQNTSVHFALIVLYRFVLDHRQYAIFRLDNQQELSVTDLVQSGENGNGKAAAASADVDDDVVTAWPKHVLKRFVNVLSTHVIQMDLDTAESSEY